MWSGRGRPIKIHTVGCWSGQYWRHKECIIDDFFEINKAGAAVS